MKVAFNISPLKTGHSIRGIGLYTTSLLAGLKRLPDIEVVEFTDINSLKQVDLVHYPTFELFQNTLPIFKKFPTVVTIHDVIPLVFPERYPPGIKGKIKLEMQKIALRNVKAVITDSESSKNDIVRLLGVKENLVHTVYLAALEEFKVIKDKKFLKSIKEKYKLPNQFVLYTGNINWNKNLINLTQACKSLDVPLVIVGKDFLKRKNLEHLELKHFKEFLEKFENDPNVITLGFVETEELIGIMNLSTVGVLASFYEGFGLPILEMQACGLPVVTSDISSMPEVAGNSAILVNPYNSKDISDAIKSILSSSALRERYIKRGLENIKNFSWGKVANETVNVYKDALNEH